MVEFKTIKKSLNSLKARPTWDCRRVEKKTTMLNTVIIVLGIYSITNLKLQFV